MCGKGYKTIYTYRGIDGGGGGGKGKKRERGERWEKEGKDGRGKRKKVGYLYTYTPMYLYTDSP